MRRLGSHSLIAFLIAFLMRGPLYAGPLEITPAVYLTKGSVRLLVVVAPLDARAKVLAGLVEHAAETAVDASDRFDVMRGIDAFDGSAARARYDKANEATNLASQAKKALEDLDSATATKQYAAAVTAWKQADLTKGIDGLIEAQIGKAAGHSVSEENPAAKQEIERALVLAPKTKLSDAQFPPELLKFAESRRTAFKNAKGKLTVRTEPPGARVWVDGVFRGVSPTTAEQLAPGEKHLVVAALAGFTMAVEEVSTGDQLVRLKPAELAFQLQGAIDKIGRDPDGPGRDAAAKELGGVTLADQVLLVVTKKGAGDRLDATALRLDVKDGHNYAFQSGELPADLKGIGDWVASLLASDSPRDGKKPVSHFSSGSAGGGSGGGGISGKRVVGFVLLGGAVLAGASWGVFGFSALNQSNIYRSTFQVETLKSNQAKSSGRLFSIVADVSWAVGAVLLVAGVLLGFTPLFGGGSSGGSRSSGGSSKPPPPEDDAMRAYRQHLEEQRRLDEERQQKAKESPPPEEQPKPEEKKPEEKKPEEKPAEAPPQEEKKKLTPAEERAEKKRKAEEEKAEKKRKAEEEKAEKKRLAEEAKKKAAEEKAEKKRKAEEEKAEKKRQAEEAKQKKPDEAQKPKDDEQKKSDEAEARRADEERKKKEEDARKKEAEKKKDEEKKPDRGEEEPKKKEKLEDDDLRNF